MATRLYFKATTAAAVSPTPSVSWGRTTDVLYRKLTETKGSTTLADGTPISVPAFTTTLERTYVSTRMASGILFDAGTTLTWWLQVAKAGGGALVQSAVISIRILSEDGATVRLASGVTLAGPYSEYPTAMTSRQLLSAVNVFGSSYTTVAGDRLVIGLGHYDGTGGSGSTASSRWGENGTDISSSGDTASDINPWVEFSTAITFIGESGGDTTPPTIASWATNAGGTQITGTLSESGCTPSSGTGGFTLAGTSATVSGWAISSTTITLTLSGTVLNGETVTLDYDDGTASVAIADAAENLLADISAASVTNNVPDTTPPTASSWATNSGGNRITATLSESGCTPSSGTGGFTLSGTSATVSSWTISGTLLTLILSGTILDSDVVTLDYDDAMTSDDIMDAATNNLADISGASVTNNVSSGGGASFSVFGDSIIN
jgi:hypothetical protein